MIAAANGARSAGTHGPRRRSALVTQVHGPARIPRALEAPGGRACVTRRGCAPSRHRPAWDAQHRGLLAGQSLMLDLQRMDFAYMERYRPLAEGSLRVSLRKAAPAALEGLKQSGRALFSIDEALFDEEMPDEYGRRIQSVRVELRGLPGRSGIGGRLALIDHRVHPDRERSEARSVFNLFGRQSITLSGAETDTAEMKNEGGRFRAFERCGVSSTWMLSIPAAVKAIEDGRQRSRHRTALEKLEDVILEIRYAART